KKDDSISYTMKGGFLGKDRKTGKQVTTTISAKTLRMLDRKVIQARLAFEENGSTKKEAISIEKFSDLAEFWFTSYQNWVSSDNTLNRVRGYLDSYLLPTFGDFQIDQISSSDIQLWINNQAQKAKKSVESGVRWSKKGEAKDFGAIAHKLSDIFDFGMTNFRLQHNPAKNITIPPKPKSNKKRVMVLQDEELSKWIEFQQSLPNTRANRRFNIICETLLASALRINELLALTIDDLDFSTNEITVSKTLMWKAANRKFGTKGQVVCKNTTKTDSGNRSVSVSGEILEGLRSFHNEMNEYFEKNGLPQTKLIFPTIYGNYMCDRNERATLKKRLTSIGLPEYGFHLFRHTHASLMLNAGLNWKELQVRMGHKSISTTMDTYAELAPKKKAEAVNIFLDKIASLS
ncbi:tyrosine-type recombinase/integrase, partial [Streptococcus ruminantium]|uniref:tyrosine-type recombinase/integrase n=1 Tax=Streptococcus ruminantium TaxID=1917441 RepID=UPI00280FBD87